MVFTYPLHSNFRDIWSLFTKGFLDHQTGRFLACAPMIDWLLWGVLLFAQNASHTATTRARASGDPWRTAWASIPSNGIWFASQFFIVQKMIDVRGDTLAFALTAVFYIILTAAGSAAAHWWLLRRGK